MDVITVFDLAALRALSAPVTDGVTAYVSYHSSAGDAGGGVFIWDQNFVGVRTDDDYDSPPSLSPSLFDDDGTFIKPTSITAPAAGRWRRQESLKNPSELHADWFGADPSGASDSSAAIQAAHDALPIVTLGLPRRVTGTQSDGSDTPATAYKYLRSGAVVLSGGTYLLGSPLELSIRSTLRGQGKAVTILQAMANSFALSTPPTAPDYGDEAEETFMVRFSKPLALSSNNGFNTRIEELSIDGNVSAGNEAVSGLWFFGAQGSHIRNIEIHNTGFRGVYNEGVSMLGSCWLEGCLRGPLLDFTNMNGMGQLSNEMSVEHCNQGALYIDPANNLPYAAVRLKDTVQCHFDQLQCETSPVDISIINGRSISIGNLVSNPVTGTTNGYDSYGIHVTGDSYGLAIPPWRYIGPGTHMHQYWDASFLAGVADKVGEVLPRPSVTPPPFEVTAEAEDNGVPVATSVVRKPNSLGWLIVAPTATATTSNCTIKVVGTQREWEGNENPYHLPYSEGGLIGRVTVIRAASSSFSARISRWLIFGRGIAFDIVPDGADVTYGPGVPPAATLTVSNLARPELEIFAANDSGTSTRMSLSIEIL